MHPYRCAIRSIVLCVCVCVYRARSKRLWISVPEARTIKAWEEAFVSERDICNACRPMEHECHTKISNKKRHLHFMQAAGERIEKNMSLLDPSCVIRLYR